MKNNNYWRANYWCAFDFDGSLSIHDNDNPKNNYEPTCLVELMADFIKKGIKVKILTGRPESEWQEVKDFCIKNGLGEIEITNVKDKYMRLIYDDRAIGVVKNTGVTHDALLLAIRQIATEIEVDCPQKAAIVRMCDSALRGISKILHN